MADRQDVGSRDLDQLFHGLAPCDLSVLADGAKGFGFGEVLFILAGVVTFHANHVTIPAGEEEVVVAWSFTTNGTFQLFYQCEQGVLESLSLLSLMLLFVGRPQVPWCLQAGPGSHV